MNERHPTDEDLAGYADASLETHAREGIEGHLADCDTCRLTVRDLTAALEAEATAPPGSTQRILDTLSFDDRPGGRSMNRFARILVPLAAAVLLAVGIWASNAHRKAGTGSGLPAAEEVALHEATVPPPPPDLGGADRYLAHIRTDKPLYKPGERVYGRAVALDAFRHTPYAGRDGFGSVEITSPKGDVVYQRRADLWDGVAAFGWEIPKDQAGGTYTLTARFPYAGIPPVETTIDVRRYRVPRLKTDVQFIRKAYGPGDEVVATLEAVRAEGGIPAGAEVVAIARVDGEEILREDLELDSKGRCGVVFELLDEIAKGEGTLAFSIRDGGVQQTAAKTIPIVLNKVDLRFYPEGGDLIAGLEQSVYIQARNSRGEPADVKGRIEDMDGNAVTRFATTHEGRGMATLAVASGMRYRAVIEEPAGITDPVVLPVAKSEGFTLRALRSRYDSDAPVEVALASTKDTIATIGLYVRERELDVRAVKLRAGRQVALALTPKGTAAGVLRVTVFDDAGSPAAERLVFREPARPVKIEINPDVASTVPGGRVTVNVRSIDKYGRPVPAVLGVMASDDAVLSTVEPRKRAPRLAEQVLLGADVLELEDARSYLAGAPENVDLLLATQGWRRFAVYEHEAFVKAHGEAAQRALAIKLPRPPVTRGGGVWLAARVRGDVEEADGAPMDAPKEEAEGLGMDAGDEQFGDDEVEEVVAEEPVIADAEVADIEVDNDDEMPFEGPDMREVARKRPRGDDFDGPEWMRVYAHRASPDRVPGQRSDFTETVYWNAAMKTGLDGRVTFSFDAADSITTLRIRADAMTADGALGHAEATVEVKRPFYVEPKFPLEVSAGDQVHLPVALMNATGEPLEAKAALELGEGLRVVEGAATTITVPASGSTRYVVPVAVGQMRGAVSLRLRVTAGPYVDDVRRQIEVVPAGFPVEESFGGLLERDVEHEITIPESILPGSLTSDTAVYPTTLASLEEALARLLREPHGCFEQTSSTNYPNVMALQYMTSHAGVNPKTIARARELADKGYNKLVSFECQEKGYEWFGGDPGHEALTAYGVLEFHDMAQVMNVDPAMMKRTRQWLLDRRDGEGGFKRNSKALDSFGRAPQGITNAYILWSLLEVGEEGFEKEIAALAKAAGASKDSYHLALCANVLWLADKKDAARKAMAKLDKAQKETGVVGGASTSITRSGGTSLEIETTALAILAWMREPARTKNVEAAMKWVLEQCEGGRFGSTQATVLALKAITTYDAARARPKAPGIIRLYLNGQPLDEVPFPADQQGPIRLPDLGARLGPGTHKIRLELEGGGAMPYSISIGYHAMTPDSAAETKVSVETRIAKTKTIEGEPVEINVDVRNTTGEGQPMAVAIVGLPGGLEARAEQLKELVKAKQVDAFETRGREVILYWRSMAPNAHHALRIDCVAAIPGSWIGPASRAYLYYTDEHKRWVDGLKIEVTGK